MIHMNQQPRYQDIYTDLKSIYSLRGMSVSHYLAGLLMGNQIGRGLTEVERVNLARLTEAARHAK